MKRTFTVLACVGTLFVAACGGDTKLPNPTGKGSIRAINAMPGSPTTAFLIEERGLGSAAYKGVTQPATFDDFDYNFNFEIALPGEEELTRIATQAHKVEADRAHVFVLTGDPLSPTVTVWTSDVREWNEGDTNFEMRFTHLIESRTLEAVDFYVDEVMDPQVATNKVATVSYGEISTAQDIAGGDYVVTVTAAGDINDVLYTSPAAPVVAQSSQIAAAFDGDANDTSPLILNLISQLGGDRQLPDANSVTVLRFLHASYPLPTVDVYDDDMLTNRIVSGLTHGSASPERVVSGDLEEYFWTPENSTATILHQGSYIAPLGTRNVISIIGETDNRGHYSFLPDRAPTSVYAKLQVLQASVDNNFIDVYLQPAGETIGEDDFPIAGLVLTPALVPPIPVAAGSYDLYVTAAGDRTAIAGPLRIDAANGDIFEVVILDTADPVVAELRLVPPP